MYETISAFSNTNGGCIVVGVNDKTRKVVGLNSTNIQTIIANRCVDLLGIQPEIQLMQTDKGKNILKIIVEKSVNPIQVKGKYYKRVGDTTRPATREESRKCN